MWRNIVVRYLIVTVVILVLLCYISLQDSNKATKEVEENPSTLSNIVQELMIHDFIEKERKEVHKSLENYPTLKLSQLRKSSMDMGGIPTTSFLVSSWRSGSSIVGQLLNSHPASFYNYEPLHQFGLVKVGQASQQANSALKLIRNLIKCNYQNDMNDWLVYQRVTADWCFAQNTRLWNRCTMGRQNTSDVQTVCFQQKYVEPMCKLFPFQVIKTVRLRLDLTESLVKDPSTNVKVMLLVRDPRAIMESRKHKEDWFSSCKECTDPKTICQQMLEDYHEFETLKVEYPTKFKVLRFEDFLLNPIGVSMDIFRFYEIPYHRNVINFMKSKLQSPRFRWLKALSRKEIFNIQNNCNASLKAFGYKAIKEEDNVEEVEPEYLLDDKSA